MKDLSTQMLFYGRLIIGGGKMANRPGRKRINIDIPEEIYDDIKFCARLRNITMTKWILRACYARLHEERALEEKFTKS
jgi:hypothetical protein